MKLLSNRVHTLLLIIAVGIPECLLIILFSMLKGEAFLVGSMSILYIQNGVLPLMVIVELIFSFRTSISWKNSKYMVVGV